MHMNEPWGIALTADGGMVVNERWGSRTLKLDANGVQQWTVGQAGSMAPITDTSAIGGLGWREILLWTRVEKSMWRTRLTIKSRSSSSSGVYQTTFGGYGTGDYDFSCPAGVAISSLNGDIYIVDHCNHRIQVYTSSRIYKTTLGVTGVAGGDNTHFNYPWGVAIDKNGTIFISDSDNYPGSEV